MTVASAPGKAILLGEHAVVYGRPAIAVPIWEVAAQAEVIDNPGAAPGSLLVDAPAIDLAGELAVLDPAHPLPRIILDTLHALGVDHPAPMRLRVTSTIPIASGLGSGAAVSVAVARALSRHLGRPLEPAKESALAFAIERIHHGTPSGVDNTVVAFGLPVYFHSGEPPLTFHAGRRLHLVIGDTGIPSATSIAVSGVRERWHANPAAYERRFDAIGAIVDAARGHIESGRIADLGPLMSRNHGLLQEIGVSSPTLDALVQAAIDAGAWGAKLSGAGMGGTMLALAPEDKLDAVRAALTRAGAARTITTQVGV
jgi:mevalonate kinase